MRERDSQTQRERESEREREREREREKERERVSERERGVCLTIWSIGRKDARSTRGKLKIFGLAQEMLILPI